MTLQQHGADGRFEIGDSLAGSADGQQRQLGALADAACATRLNSDSETRSSRCRFWRGAWRRA
jgi:hypothetical protein